MTPTRSYYLDLLRAIAITLVLLRHGLTVGGMEAPESLLLLPIYHLAANGWLGVDLFFVLSGFLLGSQILEATSNRTYRVSTFIKRRALRTVPTYLAVLLPLWLGLLAPQLHTQGVREPLALLSHLLFFNDYMQPAILVTFWSLATEEKFYLLMALFVPWLARLKPTTATTVLVVAVLLSIGARTLAFFSSPPHDYPTFFWAYRAPFHFALDGLLLGVLAGHISHCWPGCAARYSIGLWPLLGLAAAILCLTAWSSNSTLYGALLVIPAFSILAFFLVLQGSSAESRIKPALIPISRGLARISYPLYLTHYPCAQLSLLLLDGENTKPLMFWPCFLALSLVSAWLLHAAIERPGLELRERIAPRFASPRGHGSPFPGAAKQV